MSGPESQAHQRRPREQLSIVKALEELGPKLGRFWLLIALSTLLSVAGAGYVIVNNTSYSTSAVLLIQVAENNLLQAVSSDLGNVVSMGGRKGSYAEKVLLYLNTRDFWLRAAEAVLAAPDYPRLEALLMTDSSLTGKLKAGLRAAPRRAAPRPTVTTVADFLSGASHFQKASTNSIELVVTTPDPAVSLFLANAVVDVAVVEATNRELRESDQAQGYIHKKMDEVWADLKSINARMLAMRTKNSLSLKAQEEDAAKRLGRLRGEIETASVKLASNLTIIRQYDAELSRLNAAQTAAPSDADYLELLRAQHDILLNKRRLLKAQGLRASSPDMQGIAADLAANVAELNRAAAAPAGHAVRPSAELRAMREEAIQKLEDEDAALDAFIRANKTALAQFSDSIGYLPKYEQDAADLAKLVELEYTLYMELRRQLFQLDVQRISLQNKVTVLERAGVERLQRKPGTAQVVLLGVIIGLLVGTALALLLDRRDPLVMTQGEVEQLGLRCIGKVPDFFRGRLFGRRGRARRRAGIDRVVAGGTFGPLSAAFRQVRAKLVHMRFAGADRGRVISVHSSLAGEGKSFLSYYLALSMTEAGKRCLLVDADVMRGTLSARLGLSGRAGLVEYLAGDLPLDSVIDEARTGGILVLPCGRLTENLAETLLSDRLGALFAQLRGIYDFVIVDTPPVIPVPDAVIVAKEADVALIAVMCRKTHLSELAETLERLQEACTTPLCAILNKAAAAKLHSYADYRYGPPDAEAPRPAQDAA